MSRNIAILLAIYRHNAIIIDVRRRREVVKLDDRLWDVFLAVLSAYLGAWFSKRMDGQKEKTPKPPAKHFKRS